MAKTLGTGRSGSSDAKLAAAVKKAGDAKRAAAAAARTAASARKAADAAAAKAATAAAKAAAAEAKVAAMRPGGAPRLPTEDVVTLTPPGWLIAPLWTANLQQTADIIYDYKLKGDVSQMNLLVDLRLLDKSKLWYVALLIDGSAVGVTANLSSVADLLVKLARDVTTINESPHHQ